MLEEKAKVDGSMFVVMGVNALSCVTVVCHLTFYIKL
jgi:hypothetical protein